MSMKEIYLKIKKALKRGKKPEKILGLPQLERDKKVNYFGDVVDGVPVLIIRVDDYKRKKHIYHIEIGRINSPEFVINEEVKMRISERKRKAILMLEEGMDIKDVAEKLKTRTADLKRYPEVKEILREREYYTIREVERLFEDELLSMREIANRMNIPLTKVHRIIHKYFSKEQIRLVKNKRKFAKKGAKSLLKKIKRR